MKKIIIAIFALIITACGTKSPERQGVPETYSATTVEAAELPPLPDPKVNILFVVDNSGSMKDYQDTLAKNISLFAERFFANQRVDYRIGVVPVYDSKYLNDKTVYNPSGLRKMNPLGELIALKGLPESTEKSLYITRETPNPIEVLKQTVLIGTQWGPEAEESFSPVLAVLDPKQNTEKNNGFYQDDAYLVVFFLTDADDVTPGLSAESFYEKLLSSKGGDASKIIIAAALPNLENNSENCKKDGRGPVQAFPALLTASGGIHADLCSDHFADALIKVGDQIAQRVGRQKISVGFTPDFKTLLVRYGADKTQLEKLQTLKIGEDFIFNPLTEEIIITPTAKISRVQNGRIFIDAKKVDYKNFKNKRLKNI